MSPLVLVLMLIFVILLSVLFLSLAIRLYFFSYIVFLLFMSGAVMLLMYFCSVIFSEKSILLSDLSFLLVLFTLVFLFSSTSFFDLIYLINVKFLYFEFLNLLKYLFYPYSIYSLFFISYLLVCLIVVYEIVKKCSGPLRMKI
uniref:NADH dehydrogenase subunit 6 n=1 Tax=Tetraleurodes acaciae TaxID=267835 RepID=Q674P3_TETAA|nr:NADH dehydrogenase subunit 6 [Tetraleurodes acaciae]AAU14156.1 NADH dehydrogenase subunit 6 [Tetraleurodes acaciae]